MIYDTYIDGMRCPECGRETEVVIQDTHGGNRMRTLRPYDVVSEFRSERFMEIVNESDCEECGTSFPVHIPIVHGVIGRFSSEGFAGNEAQEDIISFLGEACMRGYDTRQHMQRRMDVVGMILRSWTTSHIGGDIPQGWHVSEAGLPVIGAETPPEDVIGHLAKYICEA